MDTLIGPVPDGWEQTALREVCDLGSGLSGSRIRTAARIPVKDGPPRGVPLIAARDIQDRRVTEAGVFWDVSDEVLREVGRYRVAAGDIVGTRNGSLGRFGLVGEALSGGVVDSGLVLLRPREQVRATYLVHYLTLPSVGDWISRNSTGTAIPTISARSLGKLPVVLPPPQEQERIGKALETVSEKVRIHEEIAATTRELREVLSPLLMTGTAWPDAWNAAGPPSLRKAAPVRVFPDQTS